MAFLPRNQARWSAALLPKAASATCSCRTQRPRCALRRRGRPLHLVFPLIWDFGFSLGSTHLPHGVRLAFTGLPIPGLPQRRKVPRRVPTRTFPESCRSSLRPLWPVRVGFPVKEVMGHQSSSVSGWCNMAAARTQLVVEAPAKVVGTFHSTHLMSLQRSAALPFTAWPPFHDYGWCGP